jgi:hypothetical protein
MTASLGGCSMPINKLFEEMTPNPMETPLQETPKPMETPAQVTPNPVNTTGFFIDTDETRLLPEEPHIIRSRFVKIRPDLLMDEAGQAREVMEIVFNLFPDVTYVGVVGEVIQSGDGYTWSGYLRGVNTSYFTLVFTGGVFMGHFASPEGIYEAVIVDGDLYRITMIDQTKFPGGEG